ncbi:MAG: carbamoyl-phosphate synthase large subunit [bacterium]
MPKRNDIESVLIIGSGPIVIGQACEFDYSGTQACKALRAEGIKTILVNSNPATIMTDPEVADRTYIEPITWEICAKIIERERPDALLPTLGGQTGLNVAVEVAEQGVLKAFGVEMIGAKLEAIKKAEDRKLFSQAMKNIGLELPKGRTVKSLEEALEFLNIIGLPAVIRPSYTLGGAGGGLAVTLGEFKYQTEHGLRLSLIGECLIEESVKGWKEYELEVMRDLKDNVVIICPIENLDPMGIHTGDSITVAPAQTLTDKEYQYLRNASIDVMREIGVDTGGSNVQFAVNPKDGRTVIIEMNPRVSRSSALASKATGFPIAKIATKLAIGYTLDEIPNDITKKTPASFEPTIDYVVTKIPRFTFEKFPLAQDILGTQMKSVGEAMAIGRTFKESLQKCLRSLETDRYGFGSDGQNPVDENMLRYFLENRTRYLSFFIAYAFALQWEQADILRLGDITEKDIEEAGCYNNLAVSCNHAGATSIIRTAREIIPQNNGLVKTILQKLEQNLERPNSNRIFYVKYAMENDMTLERLYEITGIDPWFLNHFKELIILEEKLKTFNISSLPDGLFRIAKQYGYSDVQLSFLLLNNANKSGQVRTMRLERGIKAVFKTVDTCAAEFEAQTPYHYSTYEWEDEVKRTNKKKVIILGGGPNRIGQGIEFDYCCVHASMALKELGIESIMVNSNPETVSTDYDTSDKLYFEPLTLEDILNIIDAEKPDGVIVQFGGQTPLKLANALYEAGVKILGTSPKFISMAEDRRLFAALLDRLNIKQPPNRTAVNTKGALKAASEIGYPVLVRPSFVLGGRAMMIVHCDEELRTYMQSAVKASPEHPVLIDKYLDNAVEIDVDAISDGKTMVIGGIMEHVEEAGIHSGDSACMLPAQNLSPDVIACIKSHTFELLKALHVKGLMNVQYAVKQNEVYIIEVNPRASRTVPFVSKAIGVPLAKIATKVMAGKSLKELAFTKEIVPLYVSVKESVFPFIKFLGADAILGPEMKSTGEVMGIDLDFASSFGKAQIAAYGALPVSGNVFISLSDSSKPQLLEEARILVQMGFKIIATRGTSRFLKENNIENELINKINEGSPNIMDAMTKREIQLMINTPCGKESAIDDAIIRRTSVAYGIPYTTTENAARAAVKSIKAFSQNNIGVKTLQEYHITLK